MTDKLLYINIVAQRLSCSRSWVYELIKRKELEAVKLGQTCLRVPESSIEAFIKRHTVEAEYFE